MNRIPLEDGAADVIGKAMRGLQLDDGQVAARSGVAAAAVAELRTGRFDAAAARAVAPVLGLRADALVALGSGSWRPDDVDVPGLVCFNTAFEDMTVNSYLVVDRVAGRAVAFDTGADCGGMLEYLAREGLTLELIFLTHTHADHIAALVRLVAATGAAVFVGDREPIRGAEAFAAGRDFRCGSLRISTRLTWGHSAGGITYVIDGLERPVAVVGDAVFAGSMGGGGVSYADALRTNREEIMSLPVATVLCPGHGPLTTVGEEARHNPFLGTRD